MPEGRPVRLAEIVAALSLGIDLGFSQPMEHVLRQCLIALRIADRVGLDDEARAAVYYSALLVNVGCHSDAHEQAKWFGDDIALKATKFDFEPRSAREALGMVRLLGAGGSPLHRIRTGVEFAVSGRHDVDDMLAQHAALARQLADRLDLPAEVGAALACSYERWDGKGWPGKVAGDDAPWRRGSCSSPSTSRSPTARGGTTAARAIAERRSGSQFDPTLVADPLRPRRRDLRRAVRRRDLADGDRRRAGAHRGAVRCRASTGRCGAIAEFVDLKSPYMLGHSTAVAELAAAAGRHLNLGERRGHDPAPGRARARVREVGRLQLDLGQTRPARRRRVGTGAAAPLLRRADAAAVRCPRPAGPDRRAATRTPRRIRLPPRPARQRHLAARPDPRRRRCLPGDARGTTPPPGARPPTMPPANCGRPCGPATSTATPSTPCSPPPATASAAARKVPPGSPPGRSRSSSSSRWACRTSRSPPGSSSPRRRPGTTSSTSTPRSAPTVGPRQACSPCNRACSRRRASATGS